MLPKEFSYENLLRIAPPMIALAALTVLPFATTGQLKKPAAPKSVRLYILDCGDITGVSEAIFGFKKGQLADTNMVTPRAARRCGTPVRSPMPTSRGIPPRQAPTA
jgi:hypothetical protein